MRSQAYATITARAARAILTVPSEWSTHPGAEMTWTRLMLFCFLMGCGSDDDTTQKGDAGGETEEVEDCVPADSCCKVCAESQPCGDTCIAADRECSTEPGCACDISVVCVEDSGDAE